MSQIPKIKFKTDFEVDLYNALTSEREKSRNLDQVVQDLKKQMEALNLKVQQYEKNENSHNTGDASAQGYHTDEAEFQTDEEDEEQTPRDTDWILAKNKNKKTKKEAKEHSDAKGRASKKRKAASSPEISPQQPGTSKQTNQAEQKVSEPKTHVPPPIFVDHVPNIKSLIEPLKALNFEGKIKTLSSKTSFKINCLEGEEYKKVSGWLNSAKINWHSFADKQTRPLKVMARGLHSETEPTEIVEELVAKGFLAVSAVNILSSRTKQPLNLFMLTFDTDQEVKQVYNITRIAYQAVKIEELRKTSNRIVQCKNCQEFNHVRTYCHKAPRCVKCAGTHATTDCDKEANAPKKCANCGASHTANYRGCIIAKELQKLRNQKTTKRKPEALQKQKAEKPVEQKQLSGGHVDPTISYAEKTANAKQSATTAGLHASQDPIAAMLERMEKRLDQQEQFNSMVLLKLETLEKSLGFTKRA